MNVSDVSTLRTYKVLIEKVSKINVNTADASGFFKSIFANGENINLPVINCESVLNAGSMFENVGSRLGINLENTNNI